jgi:hypothetical protein
MDPWGPKRCRAHWFVNKLSYIKVLCICWISYTLNMFWLYEYHEYERAVCSVTLVISMIANLCFTLWLSKFRFTLRHCYPFSWSKGTFNFDTVSTVHHDKLHNRTNEMHFLSVIFDNILYMFRIGKKAVLYAAFCTRIFYLRNDSGAKLRKNKAKNMNPTSILTAY